jgi:dGTPase
MEQLMNLERLRKALDTKEDERLSPHAARSRDAVRRRREPRLKQGYRQAFSVDVDRILHSLAYTRYIDKTQVFYLIENDHITHRVLHVQLVSKIARTIGRFLGLNEDLIEAVALGHDIGHTPFGHDGERFLSKLCREAGIGDFHHNVQSVQFLERVERKGTGWNLTLQTLDGILCHDGEVHEQQLAPASQNSFETLEKNITLKKTDPDTRLTPMTLEGCVVRMADTISYVGRDIEDAIRLGMVRRSDIPKSCVDRLGKTNGEIVYTLVTDVIANSMQTGYATLSGPVSDALKRLKQFNYERIYMNPAIKTHTRTIETLFQFLFTTYVRDIERDNRESVIFSNFLSGMSDAYVAAHRPQEIVRDFIAGMTDRYFLMQCPAHLRPRPRITYA